MLLYLKFSSCKSGFALRNEEALRALGKLPGLRGLGGTRDGLLALRPLLLWP